MSTHSPLDTNALPERAELEGSVEKSVLIRLISAVGFRLGLWLVDGDWLKDGLWLTDGLTDGLWLTDGLTDGLWLVDGDWLEDGLWLTDGLWLIDGARLTIGLRLAHTPNVLVTDSENSPPVCVLSPLTSISYDPLPYPQQIPSPQLSLIVNLYSPAGRHSETEYNVFMLEYGPPLMPLTKPH